MRLAGALLAATLVLPALPARADDDAREWLERILPPARVSFAVGYLLVQILEAVRLVHHGQRRAH